MQTFLCICYRIGYNVSAVCYVCMPRPLGGAGVVFAIVAHSENFFSGS